MQDFINSVYKFNSLGNVSQEDSYANYKGSVELIEEESQELSDSAFRFAMEEEWTPDNRADALDAIIDLMVVTLGAGYRMGFTRHQLELAMSVVTGQNLRKYCKTVEEAVKSVEQYKGDSRYSDVHYEAVDFEGQTYYAVIGNTSTGNRKVLKGISWEDPKEFLKSILEE